MHFLKMPLSLLIYISKNLKSIHFLLFKVGETPLAAAISAGNVNVVRNLVLAGCDINNHRYVSPLTSACQAGNYDMVRCLLSEGYNVSCDDMFRRTIFWTMEEEEPELMACVRYQAENPLLLKQIARLQIRRLLGTRVEDSVCQLEIPQSLKIWISSNRM